MFTLISQYVVFFYIHNDYYINVSEILWGRGGGGVFVFIVTFVNFQLYQREWGRNRSSYCSFFIEL
jgi:hypothetical protein